MAATNNQRILLIEDDTTLSRSLATLLEDAGFVVSVAPDGQAGAEEAEAIHPDLIISDVMLPKLDGIAALKRIRALPELVGVPVIMLTNRDDLETIEASMESGSYDYLVKHEWRLEDIVKRVEERLRGTSSSEA
jgi:DNA-binding response OmpR family regulator